MLFNSVIFLLFGAFFFGLWPLTRGRSALRWGYLIVASLFFYGWWDWRFVPLIIVNGLIDFGAGLAMTAYPRRKKWFLAMSLVGNLGMLGAFKYLDFFIRSANDFSSALGLGTELPVVQLTLPVGISFYTFQSMSYTLDVYRGELRPTRSFLQFFAYLSMFPQLVAGPIIRAATLLPQMCEDHQVSEEERWTGLRWIVHGYFKKVVIADNLAPMVASAFSATPLDESGLYWWVITTAFAAQIYCDFSGYSDIARGLARWMGYDFPKNFDHPYIASSLRDFWTRWHISLSTWFRDYVYIPLGGSRGGQAHRNLWITMLVSGLWHGAAWTFVIWGAIHAFFTSLERVSRWPEKLARFVGGRLLVSLILLAQVWLAWVFFRAESLGQAVEIVGRMLDPRDFDIAPVSELWRLQKQPLFFLGVFAARELYFYFRLDRWLAGDSPLRRQWRVFVLSGLIVMCIYFRGPGNAFIYFQF